MTGSAPHSTGARGWGGGAARTWRRVRGCRTPGCGGAGWATWRRFYARSGACRAGGNVVPRPRGREMPCSERCVRHTWSSIKKGHCSLSTYYYPTATLLVLSYARSTRPTPSSCVDLRACSAYTCGRYRDEVAGGSPDGSSCGAHVADEQGLVPPLEVLEALLRHLH